ncbi:MAG TPA: PEP-utilizing enzyme [Candidatus Paceibacterota bacterium]|nr:PEP-utilizing enzyme [Candidatus Paceibacterota bacterium]
MPTILHPTVKRDLSLLSVQAWQLGYGRELQATLGWYYDAIFHYDGLKVNFYHKENDFQYFKHEITRQLIDDDRLFHLLNTKFQKNVLLLKREIESITVHNFEKLLDLAGSIMSFYIFIVSDSFIRARPEALESREMSEGVLYTLDANMERFAAHMLQEKNFASSLAHFLTRKELYVLIQDKSINVEIISNRKEGYIIENENLFENIYFSDFCSARDIQIPIDVFESQNTLIKGQPAFVGKVRGSVKIVLRKEDISKVGIGDIMVSIMTNVNFLPAIRNALAIVTDEGGITCHAAIIARELKKPCITGTQNATRILKDNDIVEVDATNGMVTLIK